MRLDVLELDRFAFFDTKQRLQLNNGSILLVGANGSGE